MPATIIINNHSRPTAAQWVAVAPENTRITFKRPGRTIPQNDRMWAMITDVANQATHEGGKHSPENWKALFMHAWP